MYQKRLFVLTCLFVVFSLSKVAYAAQFSEDLVDRSDSIQISLPSHTLKNRGNSNWTKVFFEYLILNDSSLWVRPLLGNDEENMGIGPLQISRVTPLEIDLGNYVPIEFFKRQGRMYLVASYKGDSAKEPKKVVIDITPSMDRPLSAKGLIDWLLFPGLGLAGGISLMSLSDNKLQTLVGLYFVYVCGMGLIENMREYWKRCKVHLPSGPRFIKHPDGEMLIVKNFLYDSKWNVLDVDMYTLSGKAMNLSQALNSNACSKSLSD